MVAIEQLHWLWWAGGIAITLIGFAIMLWAMLADRSRGRRRCPKCWYDLSHSHGMRCSECGHEPRTEKRLFRTRRRWKWAFAGTIVLLLSPGALGWRVAQRNWITHGPDTVLIASLWCVDDPSEVLNELNARLSGYYLNWRRPDPRRSWCISGGSSSRRPPVIRWDDELWNWQWKLLASRLSELAVDPQTINRITPFSLMRYIPDKRLVDDALIVGLADRDSYINRAAKGVCNTIERPDAMSDAFYAALAMHAPDEQAVRLLAFHRRHARAALPQLVGYHSDLLREFVDGSGYSQEQIEHNLGLDVTVTFLLITDIAIACDDRALAIEVIRPIAASSSTSRWVRVAAVQAMLALAPEDGVQLLPLLPQRDRREVLRYTMHQHPELATRIIDLSTYPENERIREDILHSITPEFTPMDCFFELLGEIEASNGLPRPYQGDAEDMGGLLGGLRDSRALNALPHSSRPGADNMGGVLFMLRQIRELNAQMPVRDAEGKLVPPDH